MTAASSSTASFTTIPDGGSTSARGFKAGALAAGIKPSGRPDLGMWASDVECVAAATFTQNTFPAAPVLLSRERVQSGRAQAVVFNAGNAKEWRTPNTVSIRVNGRGDHFFAYVEYCTAAWRAGGDSPQSFPMKEDPKTGRKGLVGFASGGKVHRWSLKYDPAGNGGAGVVTATIDNETAICNLSEGHKADGAVFNRFGILNVSKSADNGTDVYLDDINVNGRADSFDADPNWDAKNNRTTYATQNVRPRFDFGFSPTNPCNARVAIFPAPMQSTVLSVNVSKMRFA